MLIILPLNMINKIENFAFYSIIGIILMCISIGILIFYVIYNFYNKNNIITNLLNFVNYNANLFDSIGNFTFSFEVFFYKLFNNNH